MNSKGFTLLELLVVIIVIGVLAAIAIPTFIQIRQSSRIPVLESDLKHAYSTAQICFINDVEEVTWTTLVENGMELSDSVIMSVDVGSKEGLLISAYHIEDAETVYEINAVGVIKERTP
jgi:type IV pilus assembly protein PilA